MNRMLTIVALLAGAGGFSAAGAQAPGGKELFEEHCMRCHGEFGAPERPMKKRYPKVVTFDAKFVATHSEDSIVKILTRGKNEDMVSFKMKLKPQEMAAVAKYVRELGLKPKP